MKRIIFLTCAVLLASCSAKELNQGAQKVQVSHSKPHENCEFLGMVHGNQGDWLSGGYTSHKNLEVGALNDIRNEAFKLGANYVELVTNRAGVVGGGTMAGANGAVYGSSHSSQTSTVLTGNAFKCESHH